MTYVPLVPDRHLKNIRGNFAEVVTGHIESLYRRRSWENNEKARFFEWLLTQVTSDEWDDIKRRYPIPDVPQTGALKYLDPIAWFEQKFEYVFHLRLNQGPRNKNGPPKRILDLGTGPGHFLVICRFYGHEAIGTELPDHADPSRPTHLYNALADVYKTTRIKHVLRPLRDFPELPSGMDLVTAFSVAFNRAGGGKMWEIQDWEFFLQSLTKNVLKPGGSLFMMLVRGKVQDEPWNYLTSISEWSDPYKLLLHIRDFKTTQEQFTLTEQFHRLLRMLRYKLPRRYRPSI